MNARYSIFDRLREADENGVLLHPPLPAKPFWLSCPGGLMAPRVIPAHHREAAMARYTLDVEAISNHYDPIGVTEDLVAATGDPGWSQVRACRPCYEWDARTGRRRPNPPRAEDAAEGCASCTWSYLDGASPDLLRLEVRLERLRTMLSSWTQALSSWKAQCVARVHVGGRWVAVPEQSSFRRWTAKKREVAACRDLIAMLTHELEQKQAEERKRKRGWVRSARYHQNRQVS